MSQGGSSEKGGASGKGASSLPTELPAVDFSTFILSLGHSVLMNLGAAPDPDSSATTPDLIMAKQTIDLIELLAEKTRGNLSGEEERLLEQLLYDLRSRLQSARPGK